MRAAFFRGYVVGTPALIRRMAELAMITVAATVSSLAAADLPQVDGDDIKAMLKRGDRLVRRGDYPEAEKVLKQAAEIYPNNSVPKLRLALVYVKQRRLREAYDLSFPIAKAEFTNSNAFAVLGVTL